MDLQATSAAATLVLMLACGTSAEDAAPAPAPLKPLPWFIGKQQIGPCHWEEADSSNAYRIMGDDRQARERLDKSQRLLRDSPQRTPVN
jgi:hypothetical protein